MKKLLTIAVLAIVTTVVHASAVNWEIGMNTFPKTADDTTSPMAYPSGYTVYAFLDSDRSAVLSALEGGDLDTALAKKKSQGVTSALGTTSGLVDGLSSGTTSIFLVAVSPDSANYNVSQSLSATTYDPPASAQASNKASYTSANWGGGSWTPVAVPEPTSVALIALGLAAFGLKRKIA